MRFVKKPIMIDAVRVEDILLGNFDPISENWCFSTLIVRKTQHVEIKTLEGIMIGHFHDWIIKGIQGELYPCKSDIFEATYEKIAE